MKTRTLTNCLANSLAIALVAACLLPTAAGAQPKGVERVGPPDAAIASMTSIPAGSRIYFLSGTTAGEPGKPATGDTQAQTVVALGHLQKLLTDAGMTMGNIVTLRVFLTADPNKGGTADRAGMNAGYKMFFGTPEQPNKPARTTIQVGGSGPNLVEIDAIAVKP
jgi:2-iminobutanoate/2-iminopropanoate deaminase